MRLTLVHFDYDAPDLLPRGRAVAVLTVFSIEQIPRLEPRVFSELLRQSGRCHALHLEPVGWQYQEELLRARRLRPAGAGAALAGRPHPRPRPFRRRWLDERLYERFGWSLGDASRELGIDIGPGDVGSSARVSPNAALWSATFGYNTNLVALLAELEQAGVLGVDSQEVNAFGDNPFNPGSWIEWHKVRPSPGEPETAGVT